MKLKDKGEILLDTGVYKEVPCNLLDYKVGEYTLKLLLHSSEQPWSVGVLDISEYKTGYRLTSTNKSVSSSTMKDVDTVVKKFIEEHGIDKILAKIDLFLSNSNRKIEW